MELLSMNSRKEDNNKLQGYPFYPASEDIYSKYVEEKNINPENISQNKESDTHFIADINGRVVLNDNSTGSDLDIPGSELDDQQEDIGNEDEENNYYSLGSDEHNDLDENNDKL